MKVSDVTRRTFVRYVIGALKSDPDQVDDREMRWLIAAAPQGTSVIELYDVVTCLMIDEERGELIVLTSAPCNIETYHIPGKSAPTDSV